MDLRKVAGECEDADCPAVYVADTGTLVFQGDVLAPGDAPRLGPGEQAVELPESVVREAIRALGW
ncbi:hypothetical protein D5S17_27355 [Pseudonocardiaceae bacterium YIM PH 21723]|nr:hypothetical protein D5S17_27355 [Pseudonocardiaceae bacterium YIM PH 21723]